MSGQLDNAHLIDKNDSDVEANNKIKYTDTCNVRIST